MSWSSYRGYSSSKRWWVLVVFFPITLYFLLGTLILFLIYWLDKLAEVLGNYSGFPGIDFHEATEWHNTSIWVTIFFPIAGSFILAWVLLILIYSILAAILHFLWDVLVFIWELIVKLVVTIWEWTIEAIEYIWDTITGMFS